MPQAVRKIRSDLRRTGTMKVTSVEFTVYPATPQADTKLDVIWYEPGEVFDKLADLAIQESRAGLTKTLEEVAQEQGYRVDA